jgi:hypothetical protein
MKIGGAEMRDDCEMEVKLQAMVGRVARNASYSGGTVELGMDLQTVDRQMMLEGMLGWSSFADRASY